MYITLHWTNESNNKACTDESLLFSAPILNKGVYVRNSGCRVTYIAIVMRAMLQLYLTWHHVQKFGALLFLVSIIGTKMIQNEVMS